jgi:hypothetical protein
MVNSISFSGILVTEMPQRCCYCNKPEVFGFVIVKPYFSISWWVRTESRVRTRYTSRYEEPISVPYCFDHFKAAELIRKKPPRGYLWAGWIGALALSLVAIPLLTWLINPSMLLASFAFVPLFCLGLYGFNISAKIGRTLIGSRLEKSLAKSYSREIIHDMQQLHGFKDSRELAGKGISRETYTLGFSIKHKFGEFDKTVVNPMHLNENVVTYSFSNPEYAKEFSTLNDIEPLFGERDGDETP